MAIRQIQYLPFDDIRVGQTVQVKMYGRQHIKGGWVTMRITWIHSEGKWFKGVTPAGDQVDTNGYGSAFVHSNGNHYIFTERELAELNRSKK
ncbi:hypothetical protein ACFL26_01360 [Patescibacteria group bacterium]